MKLYSRQAGYIRALHQRRYFCYISFEIEKLLWNWTISCDKIVKTGQNKRFWDEDGDRGQYRHSAVFSCGHGCSAYNMLFP
jgi:hypothetical protein